MIIGSTGLVGSKLAGLSAKHGFQSYNTMNRRTTSLPRVNQLDITDRDATLNLVREIRPNVIVNTAAITNVDYCETHRDEARKINVEGVSNLAEAASEGRMGIARSIRGRVADLGGHVTITSLPGAGTEVEITIPFARSRRT